MRLLIFITLTIFSAGCGTRVDLPPASQNSNVPLTGLPQLPGNTSNTNAALQKPGPGGAALVLLGKWQTDDGGELTYRADEVDATDEPFGRGVDFTITDAQGKELYRDRFTHIVKVYEKVALPGVSGAALYQLFVEVNYGGNDDFLKVLTVEKGKVVSLIEDDETGDQVEIEGEVNVVGKPFDRQGRGAGQVPSEIFVSDKHGMTSIYRYDGGKFRKAGEFDQEKAREYIEKSAK